MPRPIKRALLSVADKTGIVDFAAALAKRGVEILSTGGTAALLKTHGIATLDIADYTGFAEIMDGRVKTLHPLIHGGLLGRRGRDDKVMREQGIKAIDLLAVNLYPFEQTIAHPDCGLAQAIENIDIGGPALLRAAAKNYPHVTVLTERADYPRVLAEMQANNGTTGEALRYELATKAFAHTAGYDAAIANYLGGRDHGGERQTPFPPTLTLQYHRRQALRYGENPHQAAAFYAERDARIGIAAARQLQGKPLSFNNIADADAALACVQQFTRPACVIVKHANPCGAAVADTPQSAYERAYQADPESAFGGIIAFNREADAATMVAIIERQFVEVILAPAYSAAALEIAAAKKNIRLLACDGGEAKANPPTTPLDVKRVTGGLLAQTADHQSHSGLNTVTRRQPDQRETDDLLFAWRIAKFVKSNAIVYARAGMTLGIGPGQTSRVNAARIATIKAEQAGLDLTAAAMASDAFFPFRDGIDNAAKAGITAVIQPGGAMRDKEVIAAADAQAIAMVFTGMRHFRH